MLDLAILGLLKEQPLHGYELKKRLGETLGFLWGVSFGSLYPALRRLEHERAIESLEGGGPPVGAPMPATGSVDGEAAVARTRRPARPGRRTRKAYRITDHGEARLRQLLVTDAGGANDEREFALKFAFCRHLPQPARLDLLQRRRPISVSASLAPARRGRAAPIATPAPSWSTAPNPSNATSSGSTS